MEGLSRGGAASDWHFRIPLGTGLSRPIGVGDAVIRATDGSLEQCRSRAAGGAWLLPGYVVKVGAKAPPDSGYGVCDQRAVRDDGKDFGLRDWKN